MGINLKHNSQLALKQQYIIKNTSFYSHRAEGFAVYIPPGMQIHSRARAPSPLTRLRRQTGDLPGSPSAQFGARPELAHGSPLLQLPLSCLPVTQHHTFPCQLQTLKCSVVFKLDLELQWRTLVAPGSPDQQTTVTFKQGTSISPSPPQRTRAVPGTSPGQFQVTRRAIP